MAEHEHAHAHEHAHERVVETRYGCIDLVSHMHERAATVSATVKLAEGAEMRFSQLANVLQEIAARAEAAGGIVGHVKAFAETAGGFAHASCVDSAQGTVCQGDADLALDEFATIQLVAIVMLIDLHDLEHIVVDSLA